MGTEKLVDSDFLGKLLSGSFEVAMGRVDEEVAAHPELFGGGGDVEVRTIGTFTDHVIVLNSDGQFYRAAYSIDEDTGAVVLGEVEVANVPVHEASKLGSEVRSCSRAAVEAMMRGDDDAADEHLCNLTNLMQHGAKLTPEGIESEMDSAMEDDSPWLMAVRDNEKAMRTFVGAEAYREVPKPKFDKLVEADEVDSTDRKAVGAALRRLRTTISGMKESTALARQVTHDYRYKGSGDSADAVADDFVEFVESFGWDLDAASGLVDDAVGFADDDSLGGGSVKSLARIHDGVAGRMTEMGLAAAFAERFARRFDAPQA